MDHIKDLLGKFVGRMAIDKASDGDEIMEKWDAIAGSLAKGTKPFKYDKKKLFLYAENSVIMSEITYKKRALIKKINSHFGHESVKEIVARMRQ